MMWFLHFIGADTASSRWYYFWSGFGSGPIAWCTLPLMYWRHHNCHERWCWRTGHPVGGLVRCRRHIVALKKELEKL